MNILFVSAEAFPFAKTGGLADAVGSLAVTLSSRENVSLVLPEYSTKIICDLKKTYIASFDVKIGERTFHAKIKKVFITDRFQVLFISNELFFSRPFLYGDGDNDYMDNFYRFLFFQKAIFHLLSSGLFYFDIVHCHDWQSSLICMLYRYGNLFQKEISFIYTIHNLGYQGIFPQYFFKEMDLPDHFFSNEFLEFHGKINFTKAGIIFSDLVTTVSPQYAKEILAPANGFGLDGLLSKHSRKTRGILNGIDYSVWNPATDPNLDFNYSLDSIMTKGKNKISVLDEYGIHISSNIPLLIFIGRLVEQKGASILIESLPELLNEDLIFIVLAAGNRKYEIELHKLAETNPKKFVFLNKFDEKTAHQLQGAADILVMPSLHEPCGLNQMYSLHYGTVPIVFHIGGLLNTVIDLDIDRHHGTGFIFGEPTKESLLLAVKKALTVFKNKNMWIKLQKRGMMTDFSWEKCTKEYSNMYNMLFKEKKNGENCFSK